ncbi:hypothetical protein CMO96_01800 [Candidatus Woesebacteria bacterium]|nr:hypothetical protein [Candidatus Woesebacteria bacterium]
MAFAILTLVCALSISAIAAYFSIIGLATIFPGSTAAVITMGAVLEVGKIAAAVWLHRNWSRAPRLIKGYLTGAVLVLMAITSMGIFGFLSKAHIEHQHTIDKSEAIISQIDDKIARENDYINRQKELIVKTEGRVETSEDKSEVNIKREQEKIASLYESLDRSIKYDREELDKLQVRLDALNKEVADLEAGSGGLFSSKKKKLAELKEKQKPEREAIANQMLTINNRIQAARESTEKQVATLRTKIEDYQKSEYSAEDTVTEDVEKYNVLISEALDRIDGLEQQKFTEEEASLDIKAEVGPIKYVAALVTDVTGSTFDTAQAVRVVIIILIFVFDPLAILLVLAAHISLTRHFPKLSLNPKKLSSQHQKLQDLKDQIETDEKALLEKEADIRDREDLIILNEALIKDKEKRTQTRLKTAEEMKESEEQINKSEDELGDRRDAFMKESAALNDQIRDFHDKKDKLNRNLKEEANQKERLKKEIQDLTANKNKVKKAKEGLSRELEQLKAQTKESKEKNDKLFGLTESLGKKYNEITQTISKKVLLDQTNVTQTVEHSGASKIITVRGKLGWIHKFTIPPAHHNLPEQNFKKIAEEIENFRHKNLPPDSLYNEIIRRYVKTELPKYTCLTNPGKSDTLSK